MMKFSNSTMYNLHSSLEEALAFLVATPRRAVVLVPVALMVAYVVGYSASNMVTMVVGSENNSQEIEEIPFSLHERLLGLVPVAYAAGDVLDPNSYSTASLFYTSATGIDLKFTVQGDSKVGYINVSSPNKTVKKKFD